MHWDSLFDDLESQLDAEWEANRAALDAESERLRISRLDLRSRLRLLCAAGAQVTINFNNKDSGVRHKFALYIDSSASTSIYKGAIVTGPASSAMSLYEVTGRSRFKPLCVRAPAAHSSQSQVMER